jgi:hypothetical protein
MISDLSAANEMMDPSSDWRSIDGFSAAFAVDCPVNKKTVTTGAGGARPDGDKPRIGAFRAMSRSSPKMPLLRSSISGAGQSLQHLFFRFTSKSVAL